MSYRSNYEIVIQLHQFTNIAIYHQGVAAILVQLLDQSVYPFNYAIPSLVLAPIFMYKPKGFAAQIIGNSWRSSLFYLQKQGSVTAINQTLRLTFCHDIIPLRKKPKLILRFTLLFQYNYLFQNNRLSMNKNGIETVQFYLKNIQLGVFHYFQDYFEGDFLSKFSFSCFCLNTHFQLKLLSLKDIDKQEIICQKDRQRQKIKDLNDLIQWYEKYQQDQCEYLNFYQKFAKQLRYNYQILRIRVDSHYKQKKETQYNLPLFINQLGTNVTQKQFFNSYPNFNFQKLTLYGYQFQIKQMKALCFQLTQKVVLGLRRKQFNIQKLISQYKNYETQQCSLRLVKKIQFKNSQKINHQDKYHIKQQIKSARRSKKLSNTYPIQHRCFHRQIFAQYNIRYPEHLIGKKIYKLKSMLPFKYAEDKMIIVICHGYLSTAYSMQMVRWGIKNIFPQARILISKENQIHTQGCIQLMGKRLSNEINLFLLQNSVKHSQMILNFIGHSMGGIIARATLKYFKEFQDRFGFFCSMGTPHLGYLNGGFSKTGIWVLRNFVKKQCLSLDQLSLKQSQDIQSSFLYQLSEKGSLKKFRKIILISSFQDKFVPWHSARICNYRTTNLREVENRMIENIIGDGVIHRIDINFCIHKTDIESFIGKKAHIKLSSQYRIFNFLNAAIPRLFDLQQI